MVDDNFPKTLQQVIKHFSSNEMLCIKFFAELRWQDGIAVCPRCESNETSFLSTRNVWKCKACKKQFSVKVGTILEGSNISLDKWICGIWLITNAKNGISSYEIHRAIGITQKSAWFMLHRIRVAMQTGTFEKLSGNTTVVADGCSSAPVPFASFFFIVVKYNSTLYFLVEFILPRKVF